MIGLGSLTNTYLDIQKKEKTQNGGKNLKNTALSPYVGNRTELDFLLLFTMMILEILASMIGNKKKVMEIRNGEVKSFLFTEELCLHRNP